MIKYETIVLGDLETNCYMVWESESKECLVIDPADDGVAISEEIIGRQLKPMGILATHGHFDHLLGALDLKLIYQLPFYCSSRDEFLLKRQKETASHFLKRPINSPNISHIDVDLNEIEGIKLGGELIQVIKTPGHTPGSVSFYCQDDGLIFTGDTIFDTGRGDTNHGYSSTTEIYKSIRSILELPEETIILPGHGPATNIEKQAKIYKLP
ncbi:MAG TPA: MBL fold metallo-hydrolase [Patescibacteria group bacterium]